jgi:hypothetical protein
MLSSPTGYELCPVSVEFEEDLSIEQVTLAISHLSNPQIILWYIGCYGLKKAGVDFYRNFLISPVLVQNTQATFWLVDLTAWNAFKNPGYSIYKSNSCCNIIEQFLDDRIKSFRSSKIFKKMQEMSDDFIDYFRKALHRDFIEKSSRDFPEKNIRVRDVFSNNCAVMADWYDYDINKSYSIFQYLEGCLIVDEVFLQLITNEQIDELQLVFALPNDELKYYKDNACSFQTDVQFLISRRCEVLGIENTKLRIKFLSFKYGTQLLHRPYNAPGKVLKDRDITYQDIVGHVEKRDNIIIGGDYAARW